ncbi:MAG: sensor histidine kinase KdpD [bacterium]|nr:sensor histidine kinase KdpD [bacterium]
MVNSKYLEDENRPDPDTLLSAIQHDKDAYAGKGKLKIFLGAAPGVGKTFAMLEAAHHAIENGINTTVGIVVTHGRAETEELLENLHLTQRKQITYKGKKFWELNTERIIKEKPQLVIVDELAHRNIPGSANNKRYQDILNILDAGIDVYTAVNIQHLENLKDEIIKITGINVKETVPDSIFELADETVVIDITPDELLERLKEGKVYIPKEATRALNNYFTETNISALRALAMQVAAKSISKRVISYKQIHGITDPWAVVEKTLVCITDSSFTPSLIRSAKRLTAKDNSQLIAINIETPLRSLSKQSIKRISNYKRYAEYMGAEVITLSSTHIAKTILRYSSDNNITNIVLSKSVNSRLYDFLIGSVVNDIIRNSGKINIHVLSERPREDRTHVTLRVLNKFLFKQDSKALLNKLYIPVLLTVIVGAALYFVKVKFDADNSTVALILLLTVIYSAYKYGFYSSLISTSISCLAYGYVFVKPYFKFSMYKPNAVIALMVFIIVSYIISRLTYILKQQVKKTSLREEKTTALFNYSKQIANVSELNILYNVASNNLKTTLGMDNALYIPIENRVKLKASCPEISNLGNKEKASLNWTWRNNRTSGSGTDTMSTSSWFFYPLKSADVKIGVLGLKLTDKSMFFDPEEYDFFQSLADQTAIAIDRLQLISDKYNTK